MRGNDDELAGSVIEAVPSNDDGALNLMLPLCRVLRSERMASRCALENRRSS